MADEPLRRRGGLMGYAGQSLLATVGRPDAALHQFHSAVIGVSPATAVPAPPGAPSVAYLWVPIGIGAGLALLLVLLTGLVGIPCVDRGVAVTAGLFDRRFWKARFYASAAWTFGDSGATNITALATGIAAILASSAVLTAIFNVDLNPFIIVNVACGGLVAVAPILFGIVNFFVMRGSPMVPADASLELHADATITLPSGATIAMPGGATVKRADGGSEKARIKAGGTLTFPPGSVLTVKSSAVMAVPSGAALALGPGATLTADIGTQIASGDLEPPQAAQPGRQRLTLRRSRPPEPDPQIAAGDLISFTAGATATVNGTADIFLPNETTVVAPGRRGIALKADTTLTVPSGANVMTAGMGSVLPAAILTTFASGAEIGLVAVLAVHYSSAGSAGHVAAVVIAAVVALGLVVYGVTAIQSLAEPTTGSSLSSGAGTSFTL